MFRILLLPMLATLLTACISGEPGKAVVVLDGSSPANDAAAADAPSCLAPIVGEGTTVWSEGHPLVGTAYAGTPVGDVFVPYAACVGCTVADATHVIDADPGNFALMDMTLVVTYGWTSVGVRAQPGVEFPIGTIAGYSLSIPPSMLLEAGVLPNLRISTWMGGQFGQFQEDRFFGRAALADVAGLLANSDRFFIGLTASKPFDTVVIDAFAGYAGAAQQIQVFEACSDATGTGGIPGSLP